MGRLAGWLLIGVVLALPARAATPPLRLRLVIEQSVEHRPSGIGADQPIAGFTLPLAAPARALLGRAGVRLVDGPAEATLTVHARARAMGRWYRGGVVGYLYAGAEVSGDITVVMPGAPPRITRFAGRVAVPLEIRLNHGYERPENAPFAAALTATGAYLDRLMDVVGAVFGPGALIATLDEGDAVACHHAARALGDLGDPAAVAPLIAALADADRELRRQAAWALGKLGAGAAVPALTAALDDRDGDVRWFAAWSLARITGRRLEDVLAIE